MSEMLTEFELIRKMGSSVETTRIKPFSSYICTERIFDRPPFMYNKVFLSKLIQNLVANIFTLLLVPFASKLVNYSKRSESLNIQKNSKWPNDALHRRH